MAEDRAINAMGLGTFTVDTTPHVHYPRGRRVVGYRWDAMHARAPLHAWGVCSVHSDAERDARRYAGVAD